MSIESIKEPAGDVKRRRDNMIVRHKQQGGNSQNDAGVPYGAKQ